MTKFISNANIYKMASDYKTYVEKNNTVPYKMSYGGVEFFTMEMQDLMVYCLLNLKSNCNVGNTKWCTNASGDSINENVLKDDYLDQARRVHDYVLKNNQIPNYVTTTKSKKKVNIDLFSYCVAKILVYYKNNGQLPNYCSYNSDVLKKSSAKTYSQEILEYFESKFGNVSTIDGALAKIKGRGYGYYYDDRYSNKQSIDRIYNRQGVNCTDVSHLLWHIGKALGYDVRAIHVKCRGGDGHIRTDFKNSNYGWFSRDGASVLDGNSVESVWCSNGTYLATNPSWFMENVNR